MKIKQVVESYLEGFRSGDSKRILNLLCEDVVWNLHGCQTFIGKEAFAENIDNDDFTPMKSLVIREILEAGERIVAIGSGVIVDSSKVERAFEFCEIFTFRDLAISSVETFHVWSE